MHDIVSTDQDEFFDKQLERSINGFVRLSQICGASGLIPVSKSCWWSWVSKGLAPKPLKIGGVSLWALDDIQAMIQRIKSQKQSGVKA